MNTFVLILIIFLLLFPLRRPLFGRWRWIITLPVLVLATLGGFLGYFFWKNDPFTTFGWLPFVLIGVAVFLIEGLPLVLGWFASIFSFLPKDRKD